MQKPTTCNLNNIYCKKGMAWGILFNKTCWAIVITPSTGPITAGSSFLPIPLPTLLVDIGTHWTFHKLFYVTNLAETKSSGNKKDGLFSLMVVTSWNDPATTEDGARQEIGLGCPQQVTGLKIRTKEDQGNGRLLLVEALPERQNYPLNCISAL